MPDVYFYEAFEEEEHLLKSVLPSYLKAGFTGKTIQEAGDKLPPAGIISIRTQSLLPESWSNQVSAILTRSTGYDHLKRYLNEIQKKIPCGYLPLYCNRAVAEQAMLLWMALLRKISQQIRQFEEFNRDGLTGYEALGKILVVVGVGNIGSEIVRIGQGLGMRVKGVDLVEKYDFVEYANINRVLSSADIIVCSMNLTTENTGYFNYQRLKQAKKGSIFINIARGEMSPAPDLLKLLQEGYLAGVGMDVFNLESELSVFLRSNRKNLPKNVEIPAILEMSRLPNVIFTPHNAFNTCEALERKVKQSIEQITGFYKTGKFIWKIPD
ncbi:MAG: NAD(P)-dependent oxidoreductase [Calditrichota bacterium]|jgi:D-lactate dehydrogenase